MRRDLPDRRGRKEHRGRLARRGRKALQARKARWDLADPPEKKANPVRLDLPDLLAQQARGATQVPPEPHLRDLPCASSVEPIRLPVETMRFWCRWSVPAARATVLSALVRSAAFAPESSCACPASVHDTGRVNL